MLEESFESVVLGSVDGQNSWSVEFGSGDVQTNVVFAGTQAMELLEGSVSHSISNSESAVWTRFQVFVTAAPDTNPTVEGNNASVAFFVNTNLTLTIYSNMTPVELDVPVPTHVWTRLDVYCDYESMTWNLSMNGVTVAAGVPLSSDNTEVEKVLISNNSSDSVYVDDIEIVNHELAALAPDVDGDGIPDWWEQKYFDSITGCSAGDDSGNSGWTYLQAYIAGISPFSINPFVLSRTSSGSLSWDAKPSRIYDVLWTANLLSEFIPVASNLVNQADLTDTFINTNHPSGFYKLRVRLAP